LDDHRDYVVYNQHLPGGEDVIGHTIDLGTRCPVKADLGWCPYGFRCRFLGGHVRRENDTDKGPSEAGPSHYNGWLIVGEKKNGVWRNGETNWGSADLLRQLQNDLVS